MLYKKRLLKYFTIVIEGRIPVHHTLVRLMSKVTVTSTPIIIKSQFFESMFCDKESNINTNSTPVVTNVEIYGDESNLFVRRFANH